MPETKPPLYEDGELKVDYLPNSIEGHLLCIKESKGKEYDYVIPRGILKELARTKRGGIERKIDTFNSGILFAIDKENISVNSLHIVLCQAHIEEEDRRKYFQLQELNNKLYPNT